MPKRNRNEEAIAHACDVNAPAKFHPEGIIIGTPSNPVVNVQQATMLGEVMAQSLTGEIQEIIVALNEQNKINAVPIGHGFSGYSVTIGTTPTLIATPNVDRYFLMLNPASDVLGQTAESTVEAAGTVKSASAGSSTLNVAGVEDIHVFFNPTAITGQWRIWWQALDPATGSWANVQVLFDTGDGVIAANGGPYYSYPGSLGVPYYGRFYYEMVSAGSLTFSIGITRKKNVGSLDVTTGVPLTIYLGNGGVTTSAGFPLLQGKMEYFLIRQGVSFYGVAQAATTLNVFQL